MNEDGDNGALNANGRNSKMQPQDKVVLVVGSWVRDEIEKWVFDPETVEGKDYIWLFSGMTYQVLLGKVKDKLRFCGGNIVTKLSYQYPQWMGIGDEKGCTPQHVTDDQEVEVFIQMRRQIEEVNLFVSVTKMVHGVQTAFLHDPPGGRTEEDGFGDESGDESVDNTDNEWHEFAMSETPLTAPPITEHTTAAANVGMNRRISNRSHGITIRDPEDTIRLASPRCGPLEKRKGKAVTEDTDSDSDSEDEVGRQAPGKSTTVDGIGGRRHPPLVRRRLFDNACVSVEADTSSQSAGDELVDVDSDGRPLDKYTYWGRFQEALHHMLSDLSTDPALFCRDAPPVFNNDTDDDVDAALADVPYEGDTLFVGRVFKSKSDCKIKIAIHAINRKFHFKTTRSTPKFMVMNCVFDTCPWRIYAVILDESGNFQIRQEPLQHTCTIEDRRNYHRLATTQVIGEIMQSKFVGVKKGPNAASIRKLLLDDFHVNVSYWKGWRAREIAMEKSLRSMEGSYALLPSYLALLQTSNPGSICHLEHIEDPTGGRRFKYCFVAFGASVKGFSYMRKVIIVDGTSLKGKYGGCLVSACAQDGNFQIFSLAYGVVDSENDDSWEWFLKKLNDFVPDSTDLFFISNRHASIYTGLSRVFPSAHHAACIVHLWRNVRSLYKPKRIASMMSAAARAFTVTEFNRQFLQIQRLNPGCAAYLVDIGFEHWARAHFKGDRYNLIDSNVAESWNAVLKEAREFPLICMFEYIRTTVMCWFAIRRVKAMREKGTITPHVSKLIEKNFVSSSGLAVRSISPFEYQVQQREGECFTVNFAEGTCTCMEYQQLRLPCAHAIAADGRIGLHTDTMVASAYYVDTWTRGFDEKIYQCHRWEELSWEVVSQLIFSHLL